MLRKAKIRPLSKKLRQAAKFDDAEDVILIDGGPEQLLFAHRAMQEAGASVPMFGLAKRFEEIYLPGREDPIVLDRRSNALHLVQYVRDEAHRFGITHHRALRGKEGLQERAFRHTRCRPQEAGGADTALPERKGHL